MVLGSLPRVEPAEAARRDALVLWGLASLFFLRVLGQVLVSLFEPPFLPPMEAWYSGLIPYPLLLPIQVVILVVQGKIGLDLWRGRGLFVPRSPRAGRNLRIAGTVYFAAMAVRYIVTMAAFPERRWLGGTIPIVFHFVLAAYLYVLGSSYQRGRSGR